VVTYWIFVAQFKRSGTQITYLVGLHRTLLVLLIW